MSFTEAMDDFAKVFEAIAVLVLLLGLEILVAGDLIRTVAVEPSLESVAVLGLIVLIRTFLSFSLEIEIEGMPPWRRALASGAGRIGDATRRASGNT